jgi:hypothetical protein
VNGASLDQRTVGGSPTRMHLLWGKSIVLGKGWPCRDFHKTELLGKRRSREVGVLGPVPSALAFNFVKDS